ncbi:DUF1990 family protein [soil metagenome]
MFLLREPSSATIRRFLVSQEAADLSYAEIGATRDGTAPPGYLANGARQRIGTGADDYRRAVQAMREWRMYDMEWIDVLGAPPLAVGTTVGLLVRHYGFRSLNACRIVYTFDEPTAAGQRFGFGYGTLPEHGERGEERFTVELLGDGTVRYELFAFTRPGHLLSWIGYPFARALQERFARESPEAMRHAVAAG